MDPTASTLQQLLLYGLMPLWLVIGFCDWLCHRVQRIERSAGLKESLLHLLLLAELGAGLLAVLLLQVNAAVIVLLIGVCVAHELTAWWDLSYASSQRRIPVPEQWVHGVQQMLPWVGLAGVLLLHWPQALAVFALGDAAPDWALRLKEPRLPLGYLVAAIASASLLVGLPFAEEALRCARARLALGAGKAAREFTAAS